MDTLKKDGAAPLPRDLDGLQKTLERLQESLSQAHAYGEEVVVRLTIPSDTNAAAPIVCCCLCPWIVLTMSAGSSM